MNQDSQKMYICSVALAVGLWSVTPANSQEFAIQGQSVGPSTVSNATRSPDHSDIQKPIRSASAVDTEWAYYRSAVDTEWA